MNALVKRLGQVVLRGKKVAGKRFWWRVVESLAYMPVERWDDPAAWNATAVMISLQTGKGHKDELSTEGSAERCVACDTRRRQGAVQKHPEAWDRAQQAAGWIQDNLAVRA